ncbi:hypothetical protein EVAR_47719_1 [Eumeta japonica]|uniref:Uncharacterized protein n=1 Tax=Eumeta variegata TaxID=151549 RepID=A0A4C1VTE8_EUMVA|nr:hypothetical protein EVAR_47719_1 [Eumeta japonica]
MDPRNGLSPLDRRGRIPDEKTPGRDATISPPSQRLIHEICEVYGHVPSIVIYNSTKYNLIFPVEPAPQRFKAKSLNPDLAPAS